MWFETIKGYYNDKFYDNNDMKIFVTAKMITIEEYKEITNEDYIA